MIEIIAGTALLYLVQLLLPMRLKTGSEQAKRADKAVKNLGESLPVFFTLAVLSVVLNTIKQCLQLSQSLFISLSY